MLDTVIDNLSRLEDLNSYIPSVIQLFILVLWIFIIRSSKAKYKTSLCLSLFLLAIAILTQLFNIIFLARISAEYAFMFLGVGILQIVFAKNDNSST